MVLTNYQQQTEELIVLSSIYGDQWKKCDFSKNSYSIAISEDVELSIDLNKDYPSNKPPNYQLFAPHLKKDEKNQLYEDLIKIFYSNEGSPVIFQWIEKIKERTKCDNNKLIVPIIRSKKISFIQTESRKFKTLLNIFHGSTITDRKSTFQGHFCKVRNFEQVRQFVEELKINKKIAQAKHNILAYRIKLPNNVIQQDYDDDGENAAGGRLNHLLHILNVDNIAVIVTRWYGGIHLGPDRFKHINNAAREALKEGGIIR